MNIFDEFIIGNTDVIEWGFDNSHFNQRLLDNGISRKFIEDTVKNQEPLRWENESGSKYAVFFNAPSTKDYKEIKVITINCGILLQAANMALSIDNI